MKFYLTYVFLLFCVIGFSKELTVDTLPHPKITVSPQFENSLGKYKNGEIVFEALKEILSNKDSSRYYCKEGSHLKDFMFEELNPSIYPLDQIEIHFLSLSRLNDEHYVLRIVNKIDFSKWGDEYNNYFYANYIYDANLILVNGNWILDVSLQTKGLNKKKFKYGNYWFDKKNVKFNRRNTYETKSFIRRVTNQFHIKKPKNKINYFVSDENEGYQIFGFVYSISITGIYFRDLNLLISVNLNYTDRHELSHYILSHFNLNKFLSEGIAVHLGGSHNLNFEQFLNVTFRKIYDGLNVDQKETWITKFLNDEFEGGEYNTFYYACSGILIREYIATKGEKVLKDLIVQNANISPKEFIQNLQITNDNNETEKLKHLIKKYLDESGAL